MEASEGMDETQSHCLFYRCNHCGYHQRSEQPCVFKVSFKAESRSILNLYENNIINDPTLSRDENKECEECHERGCIFFQAHGDGDDAMALVFMCTHCKHKWIG